VCDFGNYKSVISGKIADFGGTDFDNYVPPEKIRVVNEDDTEDTFA
jgi:hypothetical protein